MGSSLRKPVEPNSQISIEQEINRLLHSYSYLIKGVSEKRKVDSIDEMKRNSIHQQWAVVFPLFHSSDKKTMYGETFIEHTNAWGMWKHIGLERILEEPLRESE